MRVQVPLVANFECDLDGTGQSARQRSYIRNGYVVTLPDGSKMVKKRPGFTTVTLANAINGLCQVPGDFEPDLIMAGGTFGSQKAYYLKPGLAVNQTLVGNVASLASGFNPIISGFDFEETSVGGFPAVLVVGANNGYLVKYGGLSVPTSTSAALTLGPGHEFRATGAVIMDGVGYVPVLGNQILNSSAGDLTTWSSLNVISMPYGSTLAAIAKHHNHVVAWSDESMEFFFNAGNPTGSILQRRIDFSQSIGMTPNFNNNSASMLANFVCRDADTLFFMGSASGTGNTNKYGTMSSPTAETSVPPAFGGLQVYMLDNFRATVISTPFIEAVLSGASFSLTAGIGRVGVNGIIQLDGKRFLVVTYDYTNGAAFVYDIKEGLWYIWDIKVIGNISGNYFISTANTTSLNYFTNYSSTGTDNGATYAFTVVTPKIDAIEAQNTSMGLIKVAERLRLMANRPARSAPMQVSFSDDDYQTFKSLPDLDIASYDNSLTGLGSFKERAFKFSYTGTQILQLNYAALDVIVGTD